MDEVHGNCDLGQAAELAEDTHDDNEDDDLVAVKMIVLCILFVEAMLSLAVIYWSHLILVDMQSLLSLLNTFSAGVILATGKYQNNAQLCETAIEIVIGSLHGILFLLDMFLEWVF